MKNKILTIACLILAVSCNSSANKTAETLSDTIIENNELVIQEEQTMDTESFSNFINQLNLTGANDTFYFEESFFEPIDEKKVDINDNIANNYKIEFSYETSLSIMNKHDKYCDLDEGKHNYYPWQNLTINNNSFVIPSINVEKLAPINNYYYQNILKDIINNCDTSLIEFIGDSTKLNEVTNVVVTKYYLKLSNSESTKIISILAGRGC
ncbi:MAG: hypothetical protein WCI53_00695 [Bacteroidota bacterium]|jgi:hypothetical protein